MVDDNPLSESVRVYDGVNSSVYDGVNTSEKAKYARIPANVGLDRRLSDRDVRVYFALALYERKGSTQAGVRWMSKACGVPYTKIGPSIKRLAECGHVQVENLGKGLRQTYHLTSPIFTARRTATESVPDHACAECKLTGRKLNKACHCLPCAKKLRGVHPKVFEAISQQVDQQMQRLVSQPKKRIA